MTISRLALIFLFVCYSMWVPLGIGQSTAGESQLTPLHERLAGTDILLLIDDSYTIDGASSNLKLTESGIGIKYVQNDAIYADQIMNNYRQSLDIVDSVYMTKAGQSHQIISARLRSFDKRMKIWKSDHKGITYLVAIDYQNDSRQEQIADKMINSIILDTAHRIPYQDHIPFTLDIHPRFEFADFRFMGTHAIVSKGGVPMATNTIMITSMTQHADEEQHAFNHLVNSDSEAIQINDDDYQMVISQAKSMVPETIAKRFAIIDGPLYIEGDIIAHQASYMPQLIDMVKSIRRK